MNLIKRVTVLLRDDETDRIAIYLNAESSFPIMGYEACADMQAQMGTGVEWVRKNLGCEPEVIDARHQRRK